MSKVQILLPAKRLYINIMYFYLSLPSTIHYSFQEGRHVFTHVASKQKIVLEENIHIRFFQKGKQLKVVCHSRLFFAKFKEIKKALHSFIISKIFCEKLFLYGVGYRFSLTLENIQMSCGLSHPLVFKVPSGVYAKVGKDQTKIFLYSRDQKLLKSFSSFICSQKTKDPYKGKGCFYANSKQVPLKEGKRAK